MLKPNKAIVQDLDVGKKEKGVLRIHTFYGINQNSIMGINFYIILLQLNSYIKYIE